MLLQLSPKQPDVDVSCEPLQYRRKNEIVMLVFIIPENDISEQNIRIIEKIRATLPKIKENQHRSSKNDKLQLGSG